MPQLYSPVTNTEALAALILPRQRRHGGGRVARRVLLVHPVQHRQADGLGIDQLGLDPRP